MLVLINYCIALWTTVCINIVSVRLEYLGRSVEYELLVVWSKGMMLTRWITKSYSTYHLLMKLQALLWVNISIPTKSQLLHQILNSHLNLICQTEKNWTEDYRDSELVYYIHWQLQLYILLNPDFQIFKYRSDLKSSWIFSKNVLFVWPLYIFFYIHTKRIYS